MIEAGTGVRSVLTLKDALVDPDSGSKPETETSVGDAGATRSMLERLGFRAYVSLTKNCVNVDFAARGYDMLATVVQVSHTA